MAFIKAVYHLPASPAQFSGSARKVYGGRGRGLLTKHCTRL